GAKDDGDLVTRIVGQTRDPVTGVLGWPSVANVTSQVRARAATLVRAGQLPVLLGGCCTLLPGALAGARDALAGVRPAAPGALAGARQLGLAYLDGHLDLCDGRTSPTGEAADMPIAAITGHGPQPWSKMLGAPVVAPSRLLLLGPRDRAEASEMQSVLPEDVGLSIEQDPAALRAQGLAEAGQQAAAGLADSGGRYWVHLDVDVLDEDEFPATDYPMPGGLTWPELTSLLLPMTQSPALIGFSLAGYSPEQDPDGQAARTLVSLLQAALS
ncbi:MAG: arginase family protein, partial [Actinomycetota bacterium]